jgi:hypothetical protein
MDSGRAHRREVQLLQADHELLAGDIADRDVRWTWGDGNWSLSSSQTQLQVLTPPHGRPSLPAAKEPAFAQTPIPERERTSTEGPTPLLSIIASL